MSLLNDSMVDCVKINKAVTADNVGGYNTVYSDGTAFKAAIVFNSSTEAKIAFQAGVKSVYKVYVPKLMELNYHDVIKRKSDGKLFQITSNSDDKKTPNRASFHIRVYDAKEWDADDDD